MFFCDKININANDNDICIGLGGKIEIFSKHDHTQYKLLVTVDDLGYNNGIPLNYISFTSLNNTSMELFYNCSQQQSFIDTQTAIKYASPGHPLLLEDPNFQTPVDKRNCKFFSFLIAKFK